MHQTFAIDLGDYVSTGVKTGGILVFTLDLSDRDAIRRVITALDSAKQNVVVAAQKQTRKERREK